MFRTFLDNRVNAVKNTCNECGLEDCSHLDTSALCKEDGLEDCSHLDTPALCKEGGLVDCSHLKAWERVECEESGTVFYKHQYTQETSWKYPTKSIS